MNQMSLARIMYGTNDDFHGERPSRKSRVSAIALPMPANRLAAWEPPTLQEFFQKVWQTITRKP